MADRQILRRRGEKENDVLLVYLFQDLFKKGEREVGSSFSYLSNFLLSLSYFFLAFQGKKEDTKVNLYHF